VVDTAFKLMWDCCDLEESSEEHGFGDVFDGTVISDPVSIAANVGDVVFGSALGFVVVVI
jgi:hypothetical protein